MSVAENCESPSDLARSARPPCSLLPGQQSRCGAVFLKPNEGRVRLKYTGKRRVSRPHSSDTKRGWRDGSCGGGEAPGFKASWSTGVPVRPAATAGRTNKQREDRAAQLYTWRSHGGHMAVTWRSHGGHMPATAHAPSSPTRSGLRLEVESEDTRDVSGKRQQNI